MAISNRKDAGARRLGLALLLLAAPGAGAAFEGCYARDYPPAHLAGAPTQVVAQMRLRLDRGADGARIARLWVMTARQGHVARDGLGGQGFVQRLTCHDRAGRTSCAVDCDGGGFAVTRIDDSAVSIRTGHLMVGDTPGCDGRVDLAERPGQAVTYRLARVDDALCGGERPEDDG